MAAVIARPTDLAVHFRAECLAALDAIETRALNPKIRAMIGLYRSIMPSDRLPGRQHFDPLTIPHLLPNVWLVDVLDDPEPRFRYRLMGTRVAQAFAADITGRLCEDVHPDFANNPMRGFLIDVVATRRPHYRRGTPNAWPVSELLSLDRLFLPLAGDGAHVDIVLALTIFMRKDGVEL
jgi:hypothetical protein